MKPLSTLQEAIQYFSDFENCRQFMISVRWSDGKVHRPYCGAEKVTYLAKAMFRYNNRKYESGRRLSEAERFTALLSQIAGKRLTFAEATVKLGETPF